MKKRIKKTGSLLLALCLFLVMFPAAVFADDPAESTVTLYSQGGYMLDSDFNEVQTLTVSYTPGESIWLPQVFCTDPDSVFTGWYAHPDDDDWYVCGDHEEYSPDVTGYTTLYGHWSQAREITYHAGENGWMTKTWDADDNPVYSGEYSEKYPVGDFFGNSVYTPTPYEGVHKKFMNWTLDGEAIGEGFTVLSKEERPEPYDLYAVWENCRYVTFCTGEGGYFDVNDNPAEWTLPVGESETVGEAGLPAVKAYDTDNTGLIGWKNRASGEVIPVNEIWDYSPGADETFDAVWGTGYYITFNANGGYFGAPGQVEEQMFFQTGDRIEGEPIPEKDGEDFTGWSETPDGPAVDLYQVQVSGAKTYYAKWGSLLAVNMSADPYGYFNAYENEQGETEYVTQREEVLPEGTETINPYEIFPTPTAKPDTGKAFEGWYLDEACTERVGEDEEVEVEDDMWFYAGWTAGYTIRFHSGVQGYFWYDEYDDRYVTLETFTVPEGDPIDRWITPQPADPHYSFRMWTADEEEYYAYQIQDIVPTADMDFYASWDTGVDIIFNANGGNFPEGGETTLIFFPDDHFWNMDIPQPSRDGYALLGWSEDPDAELETPLYQITTDTGKTLYAVWTNTFYTMTFDANGGTIEGEPSAVRTIPAGKALNESIEPEKEDAAFAGWTMEGGNALLNASSFYNYVPSGNVTFTAVWEAAHKLTLDCGRNENASFVFFNSGPAGRTVTRMFGVNEQASPFASPYAGSGSDLIFTNTWNTKEDGSGTSYRHNEQFDLNGDLTLYAQWARSCEVCFDANGGYFDGNINRKQQFWTLSQGETMGYQGASTPDNQDEEKFFVGWTTVKNDRSTLIDTETWTVPKADETVLYAFWGTKTEEACLITFDLGENGRFRYGISDQVVSR